MFKTQNLYQNDEKWKNTKLGNSSETIGGWGCLLPFDTNDYALYDLSKYRAILARFPKTRDIQG